MLIRRLLALAALLIGATGAFVALDTGPPPAPPTTTTTAAPTTSTEAPTTTAVPETTTTTVAAVPETTTPTTRPTPPSTSRTTLAEPELCPGLPHPQHHQPCPPDPPATQAQAPPPASEPCSRALVGVRAVGLPAGFTFHCSSSKAQGHAGLAAWNYNGESFIAVNPRTGDHAGVGAHEACHAWDFVRYGESSEASADTCARDHGYPNPYGHADDTRVGGQDRAREWLILAVLLGLFVLILGLLTLLPAARRRLNRKDQP